MTDALDKSRSDVVWNARKTSPGARTHDPGVILDSIGVTRAHKVILLLVLAGGFFDVFEQDAIGTAGPSLAKVWGLSASSIALLNTATFGAMVVGGLIGGALGDLAGRKTLFTFNLGIYSLGGLICAFTPNYAVLLLGRVVVGLGLGGELTIALTLLTELTPTKFRASAVSAFNVGAGGVGNPAAFGFGLLIIGVLGPYLGGIEGSWRWFFGLLALPAALVLVLRRHLPETPRYLLSRGRVADANRSLSVLASGRLNPRHVQVTEYLPSDARLTPRTEKAQLGDVLRGRLLRNTVTLGAASWMTFGAQLTVLTLMPTILVSRGYNITSSLAFTLIMNLGSLCGAVAATYLNYRTPRRRVVIPGAILACGFALLFGFAANGTAAILVIGAVFQFFVLLLNTTVWAWAPELYPTRVRAFGSGIVVNLGLASAAVMPFVAGKTFSGYGIAGMFALVAVMYVILAVAVSFTQETHGRALEELHGEA